VRWRQFATLVTGAESTVGTMNADRLDAIATELRNFDESYRSARESEDEARLDAAQGALLGALTSAVTVILEELTK
jgi:hypothetical protein